MIKQYKIRDINKNDSLHKEIFVLKPDVFLEVESDGAFKVKNKCDDLDFYSYPTVIKISINDSGSIDIYRVSKEDKWELVNEKTT